jgi:hypothetical protein
MPAAPSSACPRPRPASGVRCPVSGASDQCPRLPVHGTAVQCPVRASERPGVRCPASGVGVCALPRALCPAEVRSWSAAWAGSRMAGMAGVGVVARCVHDRLVVCLSRRLVSKLAQALLGQPRRRFGPGRRRGRWLGSGQLDRVADQDRPGCTRGSFVGGSRCAARLASWGRLIGMRRVNRSAGLAG